MNFACEIASKSSGSLTVEGDTLLFHGAANGARGVDGAIRYTIAARLRTDGELWDNGKRIFIKNAGTTEIYLSIVTNFVSDGDLSAPHETLARALADKAYARGYEALENEHVSDFSALYDRVSLRLGKETGDVPVQRIAAPLCGRGRLRLGGTVFQFYPLSHSLFDEKRRAAALLAGEMERQTFSALGLQIHRQYQPADELLEPCPARAFRVV